MKRFIQILAAATVSCGLMAGVASADTITCGNISDTGPGSHNSINCTDDQNNSVTCNNNVVVDNTNDQTATSGGAFTTDNTNSGNANSGDADNNNNVVVTLGASCAPVSVATATPTTPAGGQGSAAPAVTAPAAQVVAPAGSVHAGAGGAPTKVSAASMLGVAGSAATLGIGVALRKKALQS